jgi:hypothetical protein
LIYPHNDARFAQELHDLLQRYRIECFADTCKEKQAGTRIAVEREALDLELRFERGLGVANWNWGLLAAARGNSHDAQWYLGQAEDLFSGIAETGFRNCVIDDRRRFAKLSRRVCN